MAGSKVKSSKSTTFVKGGKTKMFGKQDADKQAPGQSAQAGSPSKWPGKLGGKTKMFGKRSASPRNPGMTGGC